MTSFLGNFYRHLAIFFWSHWSRPTCDRMVRLFSQYLAICNKVNLANTKHINCHKRFKFLPKTKWGNPTKLSMALRTCQSGEILPNLVSLQQPLFYSGKQMWQFVYFANAIIALCLIYVSYTYININQFHELYLVWREPWSGGYGKRLVFRNIGNSNPSTGY